MRLVTGSPDHRRALSPTRRSAASGSCARSWPIATSRTSSATVCTNSSTMCSVTSTASTVPSTRPSLPCNRSRQPLHRRRHDAAGDRARLAVRLLTGGVSRAATLRLRPRNSWRQHLVHFDLDVDPEPAGRAGNLGLDAPETVLWFSGVTSHLRIRTRSVVDLPESLPFAFLLDPGFLAFPVEYSQPELSRLLPCLRREHTDAAVGDYAVPPLRLATRCCPFTPS